jgi:hypothetical protein
MSEVRLMGEDPNTGKRLAIAGDGVVRKTRGLRKPNPERQEGGV